MRPRHCLTRAPPGPARRRTRFPAGGAGAAAAAAPGRPTATAGTMPLSHTPAGDPTKPLASILEANTRPVAHAMTKVICTLGPSTRSVATLEQMLTAGMTAVRFDMSGGDLSDHQEILDNLRAAMKNTKKLCAIIMDTKGPEVTVANPSGDKIAIKAGDEITLTNDSSAPTSSTNLPVNYPHLAEHVKPGVQVFVGQYLFTGSETSSAYLTVSRIEGGKVVCTAQNSATLEGEILTVHISNVRNELPSLTGSDVTAIKTWAAKNHIDFLSVSFCRSVEDLDQARTVLDEAGLKSCGILAKIESKEGLSNLNGILGSANCYGCIISRGNLGIDVPAEKMFLTQKGILAQCNMMGKPAIVTRVVDTMTDAPRPTRAEATDVANAILDGADCIMLGAETVRGHYPIIAVQTILKICLEAERCFDYATFYKQIMDSQGGLTAEYEGKLSQEESLASSAVRAADKVGAAIIIAFTQTGRTARLISKYRPPMPILTVVVPRLVSDNISWTFSGDSQARQSLLHRGTVPVLADPTMGPRTAAMDDSILQYAIASANSMGLVRNGEHVVVSQRMGNSAIVKVATVGLDVSLASKPGLGQLRGIGSELDLVGLGRSNSIGEANY